MKIRFTGLVCGLLLSACTPNLMDENTVLETTSQPADMTVDVLVSGSYVSTRSAASAAEMDVEKYDIYIFDVSTNALQYYERDLTPTLSETVAETAQMRIGKHEITLPTSGQKRVLALANAGADVTLPALVTLAEATEETPATKLADFKSAVVQTLAGNAAPVEPLFMSAETYIASAADAVVPVSLGRASAKIIIHNTAGAAITLSSVSAEKASSMVYPFADKVSNDIASVTYADQTVDGNPEYFSYYVLPSVKNETSIRLSGTYNGTTFSTKTKLDAAIYADYSYELNLMLKGGRVSAFWANDPNAGVETIVTSGEWLSDVNTVTLPFTAEPYYGFTFKYKASNSDDPATITRNGAETWYDVTVIDKQTIGIKTLEDNNDSERSASFTMMAGDASCTITVKQQGLKDVGTVMFGGLEWMDRVIGATLPATQQNANDVRSYGYFYQWGRNIPFPATGEVETVEGQMTPAAALESHKFIVYDEGTWDWNSEGIEGDFNGKWEDVTASPCPEGWRLPTYNEYASILMVRNNAYIFAGGRQAMDEILPGKTLKYNGYGTNNISNIGHWGLKNQGTDDACQLRWVWINAGGEQTKAVPNWVVNGMTVHNGDTQTYMSGGKNIFRIDRLPADATTIYNAPSKWEGSMSVEAIAIQEYWKTNEDKAESLIFPCAGRRMENGEAVETDNAAFYWSGSMFKGAAGTKHTSTEYASGMLFFRPAGRFMMYVAPEYGKSRNADEEALTKILGYRNQAMPVRCVKGSVDDIPVEDNTLKDNDFGIGEMPEESL